MSVPEIVRGVHPKCPSLWLPVQQPPLFEIRDGLADFAFREVRSIPEFDLCQSRRVQNWLEDASFIVREEI